RALPLLEVRAGGERPPLPREDQDASARVLVDASQRLQHGPAQFGAQGVERLGPAKRERENAVRALQGDERRWHRARLLFRGTRAEDPPRSPRNLFLTLSPSS